MTNVQQDKDVIPDPVTAMDAGQDLLLQDMDVRTAAVLPLIVRMALGPLYHHLKNCEARTGYMPFANSK